MGKDYFLFVDILDAVIIVTVIIVLSLIILVIFLLLIDSIPYELLQQA
jgi:hypothetical protein